jgi:hypothetical protein
MVSFKKFVSNFPPILTLFTWNELHQETNLTHSRLCHIPLKEWKNVRKRETRINDNTVICKRIRWMRHGIFIRRKPWAWSTEDR